MKTVFISIIFWCIFLLPAAAQEQRSFLNSISTPADSLFSHPQYSPAPVNYTRLTLVSTAYIGTLTTIHIYEANAWWKNFRKPFHFKEDLQYGQNVDKLGHVWSGNILASLLTGSLEWSHLPHEHALYYGAAAGSLFQLFVEFEDGYSQWGFDRVDAAADILGGFYPVLQYHFPTLQNFEISASYYPRKLDKPGGIPGQKHIIVDDYEGQTFWLSMKNKLLPDAVQKVVPSFINLAVGYSVRGTENLTNQQPVLLFGLKYDMEEIIPQSTLTGRTFGKWLNFFRLPAPAIQIMPGVVWYGLYF
ncbi:MAG: DUF2279 domain-containing protein [Ignavibacteriales bacterium]|nr:DUF2279 domain-containing protein [Ignavibacteriales bacterium]